MNKFCELIQVAAFLVGVAALFLIYLLDSRVAFIVLILSIVAWFLAGIPAIINKIKDL